MQCKSENQRPPGTTNEGTGLDARTEAGKEHNRQKPIIMQRSLKPAPSLYYDLCCETLDRFLLSGTNS